MHILVDFTSQFVRHLQSIGVGMVPEGIFAVDESTELEPPMNLFGIKIWEFSARVGAFTYFGERGVFYNAEIGRYCSVADGISVGCTQHPVNHLTSSPIPYTEFLHFELYFKERNKEWRRNLAKFEYNLRPRTIIGNDVWIGANVYIKDGVTIGNGAIIGAQAVVTKNVPSFAVVAGSPAVVKKYRFDEKTIERIESVAWWKYNIYEAELDTRDIGSSLSALEDQIASGAISIYADRHINITKEYEKFLSKLANA